MAALSTLGADECEILRSRFEAMDGVTRASVDADALTVWLICEPDADRSALDDGSRNVLREFGLDPDGAELRFAVETTGSPRQRIRFEGLERLSQETGASRVRVRLSWHGRAYTGEAMGEAGSAIEIRTAAAAALDALAEVVGEKGEFRLIGVKRFRAFDADMIVVSVHRRGEGVQRFVGAALASPDPLQGAVLAVLHALNRSLGNFLATTD